MRKCIVAVPIITRVKILIFLMLLCLFSYSPLSWAVVSTPPLQVEVLSDPRCMCFNATGHLITGLSGNLTIEGEALGGAVTAVVCVRYGPPALPMLDFYDSEGFSMGDIRNLSIQYDGIDVEPGLEWLFPDGAVKIEFRKPDPDGELVDSITINPDSSGSGIHWFPPDPPDQCPMTEYRKVKK